MQFKKWCYLLLLYAFVTHTSIDNQLAIDYKFSVTVVSHCLLDLYSIACVCRILRYLDILCLYYMHLFIVHLELLQVQGFYCIQ